MTSWLSSVDNAKLRESVEKLIAAYPDSLQVVQNLITYYNNKLASAADRSTTEEEERERKKPKIDSLQDDIIATVSDISFQSPGRRKFNLLLTSTQLVLINPKNNESEFKFAISNIQSCYCVPSPAPAKGHTFALFFNQPDTDPIVFAVQQKGDMLIQRPDQKQQQPVSEDNKHTAIMQLLQECGLRTMSPSKQVYLSTVVSATTGKRLDEDRFYANVHLKNKEGCLYFLPEGILFGFKKPIVFFPLSCLASTFYSGITQHTFDLSLVLRKSRRPLGSTITGFNIKDDEEATVEFSMIEQSEYGGIDAYIKKVGINDKSMSEENMAPETKARMAAAADCHDDGTAAAPGDDHNQEDDDEEDDTDFQPSDGDDDPLEYDSDAGSSQDGVGVEDEDEEMMDEDDDEHNGNASEDIAEETGEDEIDGSRLTSNASDRDLVTEEDDDDRDGEQDITKTDNESDEEVEEEFAATEDDVEEEEGDDVGSESLGSSSEDDIDEDMRVAKAGPTILPEDAKDELEDSD
ncbi:hypothetical protein BDB00DRAFT_817279 [Zychaea mexicana]|uniref:uncharacterized protein n=1 Tax=Zychaea mexicana TaxID=64656 RepID=UPI0022FE1915|nr:uncharacterized protein BDB00DRAFT_817279 [Zychaea mexicana]KAI9494842.1 hypothetical protein BDB00DRAFT_817279 [Zychaea mexicana]